LDVPRKQEHSALFLSYCSTKPLCSGLRRNSVRSLCWLSRKLLFLRGNEATDIQSAVILWHKNMSEHLRNHDSPSKYCLRKFSFEINTRLVCLHFPKPSSYTASSSKSPSTLHLTFPKPHRQIITAQLKSPHHTSRGARIHERRNPTAGKCASTSPGTTPAAASTTYNTSLLVLIIKARAL
jgi:hypothetical protein